MFYNKSHNFNDYHLKKIPYLVSTVSMAEYVNILEFKYIR